VEGGRSSSYALGRKKQEKSALIPSSLNYVDNTSELRRSTAVVYHR